VAWVCIFCGHILGPQLTSPLRSNLWVSLQQHGQASSRLFALVNPLLEEYFWRGYLGDPTNGFYIYDLIYAGYHALVLIGKVPMHSIIFALTGLTFAGWLWRQVAREDRGLFAPVLSHMAADFTILVAILWRL